MLEIKISSDKYWRVPLACIKAHALTSFEPPQEYSQDQTSLTNQGWLWTSWSTWELHDYYSVSD